MVRYGIGIVAVSLLSVAGLALAQRPSDSDVQHGHEVFEKWCAGCHNPDPALQTHGDSLVGKVFSGTYSLEQRYHGDPDFLLRQSLSEVGNVAPVTEEALNQRKQEIEVLLLRGLDSGPSAPMTADDWQDIRLEVNRSRATQRPS